MDVKQWVEEIYTQKHRRYGELVNLLCDARLIIESLSCDAEISGGVKLIAEERQRQIEKEGWTPEHDDQHTDEELAIAAACYVMPQELRENGIVTPLAWPWHPDWWKPTPNNRIRELTKAGALIAAEIDRLKRKGAE